jgi:RimJ/RimL family protein N-acetyltransferase
MKRIVIYKTESINSEFDSDLPNDFYYKFWYPTLSDFIPPDKNFKYIIYWFFHYLRIFKNRDYSSLLIYHNEKNISSLLIVLAYFKWPFMNKKDIQFTFVITNSEYRGQGIASEAIKIAMSRFTKINRCFWYVTDTENKSSIKLCTKLGFDFVGYGEKSFMKIIKLISK